VRLTIVPVTFRQARAFITAHHRHHPPPTGMKFALGVAANGELVGVAIVGRPIARHLDDGYTAEVTRTCTRGVRNANSMLYAAAWRAARAMGYRRLITYTQHEESGASLRAAGYLPEASVSASPGWNRPSRPRSSNSAEYVRRTRWEVRMSSNSSGRPDRSPTTSDTTGQRGDGVESVSRLVEVDAVVSDRVCWQGPGVTLLQGDAREVLCGLPPASVDCVVTSPPYWGLRDYRVTGQYGLEPTVDAYVDSLVRVFDEVARVLTPAGTVWVNVADTFGGSWGNYVAPGSVAATAARRVRWRQGSLLPPQARSRPKDLQGVPWRVVFALVERGWCLREAIVWVKPNARPESVRDRLSQRYEWMFLLARSPDHWFASAAEFDEVVWRIASPRTATKHVAVGSVELARRCIAHGARPGGTVLDPFSGSGTTGVAARMLGHRYIGIDIDSASHEIAVQRFANLDHEVVGRSAS
jgi:DNA modification methylase